MLSLFYVIQYNKPAHKSQSNILHFVNNIYTFFIFLYILRFFSLFFTKTNFRHTLFFGSLSEIWFCLLTITTLSSVTAKRFIVNLYKKLFAFFIKVVNFNKCQSCLLYTSLLPLYPPSLILYSMKSNVTEQIFLFHHCEMKKSYYLIILQILLTSSMKRKSLHLNDRMDLLSTFLYIIQALPVLCLSCLLYTSRCV